MLARPAASPMFRPMHVSPQPIPRPISAMSTNWIFDLDNTLYRADSGLFAQIDARMTDYVARLLDLPPDEAARLQKAYYRDHGTT